MITCSINKDVTPPGSIVFQTTFDGMNVELYRDMLCDELFVRIKNGEEVLYNKVYDTIPHFCNQQWSEGTLTNAMRFYADDALNKTDWNKNLEEER
jgi:hypothetical protein